MNIVHKVTLKHLKKNKRRTLVTMIGVIISVAMVTAVLTLGVSFLDLMVRQHITTHGEWHVKYDNVTPEQMEAIKQDEQTEQFALSSEGYALLEESANEYKPYVHFKHFNKTGLEQFPISLIEGRLPENDQEIAISEDIITNAKVNYQIGETVTFDVGQRWSTENEVELKQTDSLERNDSGIIEELQIKETKKVTIVGIIERPTWEMSWAPGYTAIGYVDEASWNGVQKIDAYITVPKLNQSVYDTTKSFAEAHGIEKVSFNTELLRFHGITANDYLRTTLYSLTAIILGVIIIGSVALIYNAFAISVSERARHLGMLSSVGATKKQKRNSVFFEGFVIGAISIPIGILAGLFGIGAVFMFINSYLEDGLGISEKLELVVTPATILGACIISLVTIFISTYIPAQRASRISAIDAIRQTHDIKLSNKRVKTSKLVRKIFGLEAEIGLKNVKRNKKRYITTVFSLVISIVLFLSVSFFTDHLKKSLVMSQENIAYDIQIYSSQFDKEQLASLATLDGVTESTIVEEIYLETFVAKDQLPPLLKKQVEDSEYLEDDKYPYYVVLSSLDENSFQTFAEQVGMNINDGEQYLSAILIEQISHEDVSTGKIIETKVMETKVGEVIDLFAYQTEGAEIEKPDLEFLSTIEIGVLTDEIPMGVQPVVLGGMNLIVSENTLKELPISEEDVNTYFYLNSSNPEATQSAIENLKDSSIHIFNVHEVRQRAEQMILLMSIFTYGFITLISLIAIANIFNTISTSISLRTREFAMLRSVGMTPKGFDKMIRYESIFYGVKALGYGLPISLVVMYAIHRSIGHTFSYGFQLPWFSIALVVIMIFLIVGSAMLYSTSKIKKQNIIDGLRQENI